MVNRKANIDLLFRNGLKDYEVLPPPEIWNSIKPVIRKKQRPLVLLRTAAAVAALVSISFLTYRLGLINQPAISENVSALTVNPGEIGEIPLVPALNTSAGENNNSPVLLQADLNNTKTNADTLKEEENLQPQQNSGLVSRLFKFAPLHRHEGRKNNLIARNDFPEISPDFYPENQINNDYLEVNRSLKNDRWSVAAMASPTYYPRTQMKNDDISKQINSSEQAQVSYSGGVAFAYKISRKLSIQSGLYYSSIGQEVGDIYTFGGFSRYDYAKGGYNFEVLTSAGKIYTENADIFLRDAIGDRVLTRYTNDVFDPGKANLQYMNSSIYQSFSYVEMPVVLRYKLLDKAVDINLVGGVSYNFLVTNSVYTKFNGSRHDIGKTDGLNPFMFSSSLGMGMEYTLSDKLSLNLEPTFRYYMNPFSGGPGINTHPYSFGVFSGLSYRF